MRHKMAEDSAPGFAQRKDYAMLDGQTVIAAEEEHGKGSGSTTLATLGGYVPLREWK